jgi:hypothetical protein
MKERGERISQGTFLFWREEGRELVKAAKTLLKPAISRARIVERQGARLQSRSFPRGRLPPGALVLSIKPTSAESSHISSDAHWIALLAPLSEWDVMT